MTHTTLRPDPATTGSDERDPFYDNVRFLAVLLVCGRHAIEGLRDDVQVAGAFHLFTALFDMPLLIVVAGYFSRTFSFERGKARKLITHLAVPYVLFETAYSLFDWHFAHRSVLRFSLLDPTFVTWFLMALFAWRLSTPVWQQIRWPLAVAVFISVIAYTGPLARHLDMHRIFGMLPFYVLGLILRPEHFDLLRTRRARIAGAMVLFGALLLAFVAKDHMNEGWLEWRDSNETLGVGNLVGSAMRLALLGAGAVLAAAFLAVVPRGRTWFSALGASAIYGYLLHGFLVKYAVHRGWDDAERLQSIPATLALIGLACLIGTVLCSRPAVLLTRWAVQPDLSWAFRR